MDVNLNKIYRKPNTVLDKLLRDNKKMTALVKSSNEMEAKRIAEQNQESKSN